MCSLTVVIFLKQYPDSRKDIIQRVCVLSTTPDVLESSWMHRLCYEVAILNQRRIIIVENKIIKGEHRSKNAHGDYLSVLEEHAELCVINVSWHGMHLEHYALPRAYWQRRVNANEATYSRQANRIKSPPKHKEIARRPNVDFISTNTFLSIFFLMLFGCFYIFLKWIMSKSISAWN